MSTSTRREREWEVGALCAQTDPDIFHPEASEGASSVKAKKVCLACDVREECLAWALPRAELHGIWGATSETERRRMRVHEQQRRVDAEEAGAA